jgi:NitT/TauT family transport system ATP-binding protein
MSAVHTGDGMEREPSGGFEGFVEVEHVAFAYPGTGGQALADVTMSVARGEFACFLGPSGCGKSTLLNILSGLVTPYAGRVSIGGRLIYESGQRVTDEMPPLGYVFQDDRLLPWRTVRQNIELALKAAGVAKTRWDEVVDSYLRMCGIERWADAWPGNLSGGQRHRAAIARALSIEPMSILMDEPFSTLDEVTARFMRKELLDVWERTGQTIIFVTHSVREAVFLADQIYVMTSSPGRIAERVRVDVPRPRNYEDPHLTEIERDIIDSVLGHWGYPQANLVNPDGGGT